MITSSELNTIQVAWDTEHKIGIHGNPRFEPEILEQDSKLDYFYHHIKEGEGQLSKKQCVSVLLMKAKDLVEEIEKEEGDK